MRNALFLFFVIFIAFSASFAEAEEISRKKLVEQVIDYIKHESYYASTLSENDYIELSRRMEASTAKDFVRDVFGDIDKYCAYISPGKAKAIFSKQEKMSWHIDSRILYVRIPSFIPDISVKELDKMFRRAEKKGVHKIIVDVRNDRGGKIENALKVVNFFAPNPMTMILRRDTKSGRNPELFLAVNKGEYADWDLVVLVNDMTVSASEVVAGSLQIWGAYVIGTPTLGKGMFTHTYLLEDGGLLMISTHHYELLDAKLVERESDEPFNKEEAEKLSKSIAKQIEGKGVIPDEVINDPDQQLARAIEYLSK